MEKKKVQHALVAAYYALYGLLMLLLVVAHLLACPVVLSATAVMAVQLILVVFVLLAPIVLKISAKHLKEQDSWQGYKKVNLWQMALLAVPGVLACVGHWLLKDNSTLLIWLVVGVLLILCKPTLAKMDVFASENLIEEEHV